MFPIKDHNPSHKFPYITIVIILINIALFFIEVTAKNLDAFILRFALVPQTVNFFNVNTLTSFVTSMFLHGGWMHIISNMWFLWIFGDNIEASLGHIKYLGFYLFSGLSAGLLQYLINPISTIPVLGASGAIAGVLGGYLVLFPHAKIETLVTTFGGFMTRVNIPAGFMLFYWFVTQIFSGVGSLASGWGNQGGVAFFAHIGGFIAGLTISKSFKKRLKWYRLDE